MPSYQPLSYRANVSQNVLGSANTVICRGWSSGKAVLIPIASAADSSRNAIAQSATRSAAPASVRLNKGFRNAHRFGVGERVVDGRERIGPRANPAPRHRAMMPVEDAERANEVPDLASPAAADFEMLAVDLLMHVHRAG